MIPRFQDSKVAYFSGTHGEANALRRSQAKPSPTKQRSEESTPQRKKATKAGQPEKGHVPKPRSAEHDEQTVRASGQSKRLDTEGRQVAVLLPFRHRSSAQRWRKTQEGSAHGQHVVRASVRQHSSGPDLHMPRPTSIHQVRHPRARDDFHAPGPKSSTMTTTTTTQPLRSRRCRGDESAA